MRFTPGHQLAADLALDVSVHPSTTLYLENCHSLSIYLTEKERPSLSWQCYINTPCYLRREVLNYGHLFCNNAGGRLACVC